jgi:hypothetical protein
VRYDRPSVGRTIGAWVGGWRGPVKVGRAREDEVLDSASAEALAGAARGYA